MKDLEEILSEMESQPNPTSDVLTQSRSRMAKRKDSNLSLAKSLSMRVGHQSMHGTSISPTSTTWLSPMSSSGGVSPQIEELNEEDEFSPNEEESFFQLIPC